MAYMDGYPSMGLHLKTHLEVIIGSAFMKKAA